MHKALTYIKRRPRRFGIMAGATLLAILLGIGVFFAIRQSRLPGTVWLPNADMRSSYHSPDSSEAEKIKSDEWAATFGLPIQSDKAITKYGPAYRYSASKSFTEIYAFRSSAILRASKCPNITNRETQLPSKCEKIGDLQGAPIYAISRSLPSGTVEYFVNIKGTFIFVKSGGDGARNLGYIRSLEPKSQSEARPYIEANKRRIEAILSKQQAAEKAVEQKSAAAYTLLDFNPVLPADLPAGWQRNPAVKPAFTLDGPDMDHPRLVTAEYAKNKNNFVSVYSGPLKNFIITAGSCGPTPGYSMENLNCQPVAGTDYYEAFPRLYNGLDIVRYVYRPVGDVLLITSISKLAEGDKPVAYPTELAQAQDFITSHAKSADKSTLKDSGFNAIFYKQ